MASSLLDQREIVHLLRLHLAAAFFSTTLIALLLNLSAALSAGLAYGLFLFTWTLSAHYAFRFRGAQRIKAILLGFYVGSLLKLMLTLVVVGLLLRFWPHNWPSINWFVFLLVMMLSYVISWLGGVQYYRRSYCG
jgi:hypothetical protein